MFHHGYWPPLSFSYQFLFLENCQPSVAAKLGQPCLHLTGNVEQSCGTFKLHLLHTQTLTDLPQSQHVKRTADLLWWENTRHTSENTQLRLRWTMDLHSWFLRFIGVIGVIGPSSKPVPPCSKKFHLCPCKGDIRWNGTLGPCECVATCRFKICQASTVWNQETSRFWGFLLCGKAQHLSIMSSCRTNIAGMAAASSSAAWIMDWDGRDDRSNP